MDETPLGPGHALQRSSVAPGPDSPNATGPWMQRTTQIPPAPSKGGAPMPATRIAMRKIREILRLKWAQGLSHRQIAESCQVARPTVTEYIERATAVGLSWPLPPEVDEI